MPNWLAFGAAMLIVGAASQTVTTSTTSLVQLSTEPRMRGRVMALLLTVALGGQPLGAPLVGWIANSFGPRWAVAIGAAGALSPPQSAGLLCGFANPQNQRPVQ
jgi:MFS family permease